MSVVREKIAHLIGARNVRERDAERDARHPVPHQEILQRKRAHIDGLRKIADDLEEELN